MVVKKINIEDLRDYIDAAFDGDEELIELYDKRVWVGSIDDVCESVFEKISSLVEQPEIMGVELNGESIGFLVFKPGYLISFGINKKHRDKKLLDDYFQIIKREVGDGFQCALFDYNKRAIRWLEKQGMEIIFENLTILQCQQ